MRASTLRDISGMALRNLSRHRVKTVITAAAVAISVALYIFMDAWLLGMNLESRRNIVSYEMGAARIQSDAYFAKKEDLPMYEGFGGWERISSALARAGYDSAPRFAFGGTLYSQAGTAPMLFDAVDPEAERRLLRYTTYLESGRFPRAGALELAVGTIAAEKLRVGIPRRPTRAEFEEDVLAAARTEEEAAFVRSLYGPPPAARHARRPFSVRESDSGPAPETLALKDGIPAAELARLWDILAASGRMDVRIATVIDVKEAPETIREDKFEGDLLPALSDEGRELVLGAYAADPATGDYRLASSAPAAVDAALRAMLDADFAGAVRHVNQLIDAVVVGVVNSPNPMTNGNIAFLPLDSIQDETGLMAQGKVTELLVRKKGADDSRLPGKDESAEAIRAALERAGAPLPPGVSVRGWRDYAADYIAASRGDNVSMRVMIILLFVLSFIGIANTMLMSILERTKETGMLRALGMTDGQVLLAYALEAGCIGAIGAVVGMILGCLANIPMVAHGIDYSAMAEQMNGDYGYRVVALFRSAWNVPVVLCSGLVAAAVSALAAVPPTLRALRMPVTDSLRFE